MKQKTLENYFSVKREAPKRLNAANSKSTSKMSQTSFPSQNEVSSNNKFIQKDLISILLERERVKALRKRLGDDWEKKEGGFGYTDDKQIILFDTINNFQKNFFNVYKKENFKKLEGKRTIEKVIPEGNDSFFLINQVKYNCNYVKKALQILGDKFQLYQHEKLKLLFLKNSEFAVLLCPRI